MLFRSNCHPKSSLDLSKDLPVADSLAPILSLSENLKVLPLQRTTVEDPLELLQWHYTIDIDPPDIKPLEAIHPFKAEVCNTQLLDLFSSERNLLSLSLSPQDASLPLLEEIHVLVLKAPTGYTLPFFKLNSLGEEALDLKALEALEGLAMLKAWESAYYEFVSSL